MLKPIHFNGYTYYGNQDDKDRVNGSFQFNKDYFQSLMDDRRYQEAADYAKRYTFDDINKQKNYQNAIYEIQRNGRISNAIYNRIGNSVDKQKVQFYQDVFMDDGLSKHEMSDNPFADKFIKLKQGIGTDNPNEIADVLELKIAPKTQRLFGSDNPTTWVGKAVSWLGDQLLADNDNNVDNFYNKLGMSKDQLEDNGVKVVPKDGTTILVFDSKSPLANKILYASSDVHNLGDNVMHPIKNISEAPYTITGYKRNRDGSLRELGTTVNNANIGMLIDGCKEVYDKAYEPNPDNQKFYSSTVSAGNIFDTDRDLIPMLKSGQINNETFNTLYKLTGMGQAVSQLKSATGLQGKQLYGTEGFFNDGDKANSKRLIELDDNQRAQIIARIQSAEDSNIQIQGMVSNGRYGALITVDDANKEEGVETTTGESEKKQKHQTVQVFVPGLWTKQVQNALDSDTKNRAVVETNSMLDYGYDYKTRDGDIKVHNYIDPVTKESVPQFIMNNEPISQEDAINRINKDMILDDAKTLKLEFINNNNQMTDFLNFDAQAKALALKAGNDMYPDIPLTKADGTPFTDKSIFDYKTIQAVGKKYQQAFALGDAANAELNRSQYQKLSDIMDIYNYIINDAIPYYNAND